MFSKLTLAAAIALPLGMLGLSGAALADADYNPPYYIPVKPLAPAHKPAVSVVPAAHHPMMSCMAAERMITADGYRHVKARDCGDRDYVFRAVRHGHAVVLHVDPRNGHVSRA